MTDTFVQFVQRTHPGMVPYKQINEDSAGAFLPGDARLASRRGALLVVADGIGGETHGEIASAMAVETINGSYYGANPRVKNRAALVSAIEAANQAILERANADPDLKGMGTTVTAMALTADGKLVVANVGDSRGYILRDGEPQQVTVDHTWVAEIVAAGDLTLEEAKRSSRAHQITRSVGRHPGVEVDSSVHKLRVGDRLLLCSDGLTDMVAEAQIAQLASHDSLDRSAGAMVDLANANGGLDNIAVVLAQVQSLAKRSGPWFKIVAGTVLVALLAAIGILAMDRLSPGPGTDKPLVSQSPTPTPLSATEPASSPLSSQPAKPDTPMAATATLAPTSTPLPASEPTTAPTEAPTEPAPARDTTITIAGLNEWGLECSTLVLMQGDQEVGRVAMSDHLDGIVTVPTGLQPDWFRFEGQGEHCPWHYYSAEPSDPNRVEIVDGQARITFNRKKSPPKSEPEEETEPGDSPDAGESDQDGSDEGDQGAQDGGSDEGDQGDQDGGQADPAPANPPSDQEGDES